MNSAGSSTYTLWGIDRMERAWDDPSSRFRRGAVMISPGYGPGQLSGAVIASKRIDGRRSVGSVGPLGSVLWADGKGRPIAAQVLVRVVKSIQGPSMATNRRSRPLAVTDGTCLQYKATGSGSEGP